MKFTRLALLVFILAIALFFLLPNLSWASDDAALIFKTKCAACHGAAGKGDSAIGKKQNIPSFGSDEVKKKSNAELADMILNGGTRKKPGHAFANKGVSKADAEKLAAYIKQLGQK